MKNYVINFFIENSNKLKETLQITLKIFAIIAYALNNLKRQAEDSDQIKIFDENNLTVKIFMY